MKVTDAIKEIAQEYKEDEKQMVPAIRETQISEVAQDFKDFFGLEIPNELLDFYKLTGGLTYNTVIFYTPFDYFVNKLNISIYAMNDFWQNAVPNKDFIYLGTSAMDFYAIRKSTSEFCVLEKEGLRIVKTYKTFNAMMEKVFDVYVS